MNSSVIDSKLASHKVFKDLKDSFDDSSDKLCNLIELKDDVLYIWNPVENCLLSVNLKYVEEHDDNTTYQKLHLLSPPSFAVERLLCGACGTRLCLWGRRGAVVAELPSRWGRAGLFDGGKETVLCKSYAVDERFLHAAGDVRRVHWHPASLSHVLVLVSDNTIRLYNIALKHGPKLVSIYTTGPKPSCLIGGRRILDTLGDTAVDFAPLPDTNTVLVLKGDGNVCCLDCDLDSKSSSSKLSGPLAMFPPADDNYGSDSCSLLVLGGARRPALVVLASSCAILYHAVLSGDNYGSDSCSLLVLGGRRPALSRCCLQPAVLYHAVLLPHPSQQDKKESEYALYVIEAVELSIELGAGNDSIQQYSYPVHLYPCPGSSGTYLVSHAAGVHAVAMPAARQLHEFMMADEGDIETQLSSLCQSSSAARYLVRTQYGGARPPRGVAALTSAVLVLVDDDKSAARYLVRTQYGGARPPRGVAALTCAVLVLVDDDKSGQAIYGEEEIFVKNRACPEFVIDGETSGPTLITRQLEPYELEEQLYKEMQLSNPALEDEDLKKILKERQRLSFTSIIQEILAREVSQPLLRLNRKDEPEPQEALEFLTQATLKLRREYISRQQRALDAIRKKSGNMRALRRQQAAWQSDLQKDIEEAKQQSEVLKEKCALAERNQEDLKDRCSLVIRQLQARSPATAAERQVLAELQSFKDMRDAFEEHTRRLKLRQQDNMEQMKKWKEDYKKKDIALGQSHSETISSILNQQTKQISTLIEETKLLKDQLSIV
ncbi:hypothetical protein JYU34_012207 [Plutella xylostella]|uniref:Nuclear pore complex protein Nup88 n=1 Tax=Plutella xylostella TaxID=51655 RepID=A0ABQ7QEL7_PLUXY|nr:hypothetical protein JYU34_012207 [Plutella xylostella]